MKNLVLFSFLLLSSCSSIPAKYPKGPPGSCRVFDRKTLQPLTSFCGTCVVVHEGVMAKQCNEDTLENVFIQIPVMIENY